MYYLRKSLLLSSRIRYSKKRNTKRDLMLDRNERTIELNKKIIDKLSKKISKVNIGLYPELDSFYSKLSKWLRVKKENLFITEGVSGGIKSIIETTCK